jgi:hypothetical protein
VTHRIVAVSLATAYGPCDRCGPDTPHNVTVRCKCGAVACGISDHIWTVTARDGDRVTLSPSFNWLVDPGDPSKGSHLHDFVTNVPVVKIGALHGVE